MDPFKIFDFLTPPPTATGAEITTWHNKVAGMITIIILAFPAMFWLVNSTYLPKAEAQTVNERVAKDILTLQTDVKQLVADGRTRDLANLREQLLDIQLKLCRAPAASELRDLLLQSLGQLRSTYIAKAGSEFPIIPCSELQGL
jgi:hypothetical protein